jgi:hypothetical protein
VARRSSVVDDFASFMSHFITHDQD